MKEPRANRKRLRLPDVDYRATGAYFVTICTQDRRCLFSPVGADSISARMVERTFLETIARYSNVEAPSYVVMPNRFHAIITISRADMESAPTGSVAMDGGIVGDGSISSRIRAERISTPAISDIIQAFKRYSTIEYIRLVKEGVVPPFEKRIWQRSFYDHIIHNQEDYDQIAEYIMTNPMRWHMDSLYAEE